MTIYRLGAYPPCIPPHRRDTNTSPFSAAAVVYGSSLYAFTKIAPAYIQASADAERFNRQRQFEILKMERQHKMDIAKVEAQGKINKEAGDQAPFRLRISD